MPRLTQKQYARHIKRSPQYVNKLVRQGKVRLGRDGKIDAAQADRALAQTRERARTPGGGRPKKGSNAHGGGRPPRVRPAAAGPGAPARASATQSLTSARAADAAYQAKLRKLEYEKAVGELLPAAEVREAERRKNANLRTRFRRLPRGVAQRLAYTTRTPAEIERILLEAIDHELAELAADPLGTHPEAPVAPTAEGTAVPVVQTSAGTAEVTV